MKILVLGGNRFIGATLIAKLLNDSSLEITVFNRKGTGASGVNIVKGNRNNIQDLDKIKFESFDYVIDMCLFKPEQFELIKPFLLKADLKKYIFISSASVGIKAFGDYAIEKEQVELLLKQTSLKYEIIRPVYVVGENSHRPRLGYYINQIENNKPINIEGDGSSLINLIHVDDVVNFIIEYIFNKVTYGTYILSNGENLKPIDIINKISLYIKNNNTNINLNSNEAIFLNEEFTFQKFPQNSKTLNEMLPQYIKWFKLNKNIKYGY